MAMVALNYIDVDERGVARIAGSRIKVLHLVMTQRAEGYSAEQLLAAYPHLPAEAVYAALAYYHANKPVVDRQIEESVRFAEEMRAKATNQLTRADYARRWADKVARGEAREEDRPEGLR